MKKIRYTSSQVSKGFFGLIDRAFMETFGLIGGEYDAICEFCTERELEILWEVVEKKATFAQKRESLKIVNRFKYAG